MVTIILFGKLRLTIFRLMGHKDNTHGMTDGWNRQKAP